MKEKNGMSKKKTVRVYIGGGVGLEDVQAGIRDLLVQLNSHFRPHGVEFLSVLLVKIR